MTPTFHSAAAFAALLACLAMSEAAAPPVSAQAPAASARTASADTGSSSGDIDLDFRPLQPQSSPVPGSSPSLGPSTGPKPTVVPTQSVTAAFSSRQFAPGRQLVFSDLATTNAVPVPPANQTLALMQAIQIALTNPVQRFKWQVQQDQANQAVSLAKSNFLPQISTVASANLVSTNNILTPDPQGNTVSGARQRVGLAATYPLFDDGLLYDQRKIAEAEALATNAMIQSDQHASVSQTVNTFFALLEAQRTYDSQNAELVSAAELYKTAQAQYQVGTVAKVDVLTAKSTYEAAVNQAAQAAGDLITARGTLAQTLGQDPSQYMPSVSAPDALPALGKPLDAITSEALHSAPARDVLAEQRSAEQAKLSAVRAQKSPSVSLVGGVGYAGGAASGRNDSGYSYITLNVSVPLLNNQAQRAAERAAADSVLLTDNAIQTTDTATRLAVIQDYTLYQSSLSQIEAAQASSDAAAAALDLAQKEYAVGKGPLSQVELALTAAGAAGLQYGDALDRRDSALVSLELLTGELDIKGLTAKPVNGPVR